MTVTYSGAWRVWFFIMGINQLLSLMSSVHLCVTTTSPAMLTASDIFSVDVSDSAGHKLCRTVPFELQCRRVDKDDAVFGRVFDEHGCMPYASLRLTALFTLILALIGLVVGFWRGTGGRSGLMVCMFASIMFMTTGVIVFYIGNAFPHDGADLDGVTLTENPYALYLLHAFNMTMTSLLLIHDRYSSVRYDTVHVELVTYEDTQTKTIGWKQYLNCQAKITEEGGEEKKQNGVIRY